MELFVLGYMAASALSSVASEANVHDSYYKYLICAQTVISAIYNSVI